MKKIMFNDDYEINREPSLPSNLDEAAEEYAFTNWEDNDYHEGASEGLPFDPIGYTEKVFKAGAEWMMRQGKSFDGIVRDDGFVDFDKYGSSMMIPSNTSCFNNGDKVIIQIRKKQ